MAKGLITVAIAAIIYFVILSPMENALLNAISEDFSWIDGLTLLTGVLKLLLTFGSVIAVYHAIPDI